jgi:hypothetical protein
VGAAFVATDLRQRAGKGICTLWTPYTQHYFATMRNIYARYTQDMRASAADHAFTYFIILKRQLVTSTFMGLNIDKFKPLRKVYANLLIH